MSRIVHFAYPGDIDLKTGGYAYDRQLIAGLRNLGWTVHLVPLGDGFPSPDPSTLAQAERSLDAIPDGALVIIDGLAFGTLARWSTANHGRLTTVALVHHPLALETGLDDAQRDRLRASELAALPHADAIIVTSPETARELVRGYGVGESRITVALPGTEPAPLSAGTGQPPHILSIGSLIPRKGHDVLIDALSRLTTTDWRCTIIGGKTLSPPTAQALQAQIDGLGLEGRITLAGSSGDTRSALQNADLFALASHYEGYGMVFAEALSQGVPIIACRAGAIPDVVPEGAGLLVPPGDPDAFAEALRMLLTDRDLRRSMARTAAQAGAALPRWEDTSRTVSTLLEQRA